MINAMVTGNLGKDAELRDAGESTVCSFSVASNAKVKGEDVTTWVRCSIWGNRGEALAKYLTKGTKVAATGTLSTRDYDGKTYLDLRVDQIDFMGGGKKEDDGGERRSSKSKRSRSEEDDDIPF